MFATIVISIATALLRSGGSISIGLWILSFLFSIVFLILWSVHRVTKKQDRFGIKLTLAIESLSLLVLSVLMGGNNQNFGYSDPYSVTFLGKIYQADDPAHDHMEKIINFVFAFWAFTFIAILLTVFLSLFLRNESEQKLLLENAAAKERENIKNKERNKVLNFLHITIAFIAIYIINSNIPKAQDPYRTFIDFSFINIVLWIAFFISCFMLAFSNKHLRYPALVYTYQAIGIISTWVASGETKDLYGVRYGNEITILKAVGLIAIVLVIVMFVRSALYIYDKPKSVETT